MHAAREETVVMSNNQDNKGHGYEILIGIFMVMDMWVLPHNLTVSAPPVYDDGCGASQSRLDDALFRRTEQNYLAGQ
jgi:hypothetical protein